LSTNAPRLLAFDTATELCSVALLRDGEIFEYEEEIGRAASARILGAIDTLLREAGISLRDLDALAFGRGPGGFTGVRLAASIAQGLAFGAELPVIPVSDLEALAERGFALTPQAVRMLVCSDARMREVYWAEFRRTPEATLAAVGRERVGAPESVQLDGGSLPGSAAASEAVAGIGRGFEVYPGLAAGFGARLVAIHGRPLPRAREMLVIAEREWRAGRLRTPAEALPVYLRDEVAQPPKR
jgi:tRNA threonylcarbamoyladenosine biosynthesis protein TsaB